MRRVPIICFTSKTLKIVYRANVCTTVKSLFISLRKILPKLFARNYAETVPFYKISAPGN